MTDAIDIRGRPGVRFPPGPTMLGRILSGKSFRQSPVDFIRDNAVQYGDFVHYRALEGSVYQFNHPALIQEIIVDHERHNRRVRTMQRARSVLGDGLLTSEEPLHMRQRRMAAPAFHRQRIAAYGDVISGYAARMAGSWQPGEMNVHPQMLMLALQIVGKCLFDIDKDEDAQRIAAAVGAFLVKPPPGWIPAALLERLQKLPIEPVRRVRRGLDDLDAYIFGMIANRRAAPGDRGDLLSMLLAANDEEATDVDRTMSDKQVRDECLTVLLAGHETTANALSFTLWFLSRHPDAQEKLHLEAVRVLGARPPEARDYPELRYAWMVFAEAMRLLPTVWVLGRSCGSEPYDFHGYRIEPGAALIAPQIVAHRDPRFWDDPESFTPERFAEDGRAGRPKFSYFPFGGGSRQCIGESLAWMEGVFVIATIFRDWRVRPVPGAPAELPILPGVNLRPRAGVRLLLERR